ncbi:MAG: putative transposase [Maricaulis maris]|jgi:putative transposase
MFSAQIRKRRVVSQKFSNWAWHIEEDFVAINGALHDL